VDTPVDCHTKQQNTLAKAATQGLRHDDRASGPTARRRVRSVLSIRERIVLAPSGLCAGNAVPLLIASIVSATPLGTNACRERVAWSWSEVFTMRFMAVRLHRRRATRQAPPASIARTVIASVSIGVCSSCGA
jgi:hypothetical protein